MNNNRDNFGRALEVYFQKMLSSDAERSRGSAASFVSNSGSFGNDKKTSLGADLHQLHSCESHLLDVRMIRKWFMIASPRNEIVDHCKQHERKG